MRRNIQSFGEQANIQERDVVLAAFYAADVASIQTCLVGQRLLGKANSLAKLAEALSEQHSDIFLHRAKDARLAVFMSTGYNYHSFFFGGDAWRLKKHS